MVVSMERTQLPTLEKLDFEYCALCSTPNDPECRIMFLYFEDRSLMFCKPGDDEYVMQELNVDERLFTAATIRGKVYCLTLRGKALVVADLTGPTLQFRQVVGMGLRHPARPENVSFHNYLIESCDELLLVYKIYLGFGDTEALDFKVFRADFSTMVWIKVESIGDRTIFLDIQEGTSCCAIHAKTKANCIYFTNMHDRNMYMFNMED